jgi:hypothetical protein
MCKLVIDSIYYHPESKSVFLGKQVATAEVLGIYAAEMGLCAAAYVACLIYNGTQLMPPVPPHIPHI